MSKTIADLNRAANAAWDKYAELIVELDRAICEGRAAKDINLLRRKIDEQILVAATKSIIANSEASRKKSSR